MKADSSLVSQFPDSPRSEVLTICAALQQVVKSFCRYCTYEQSKRFTLLHTDHSEVPVRSPWQARRASIVRQQRGGVAVEDIDKPIHRGRRATVSCDSVPNRSQELHLMLKWQKTLENLSPRSTMILSSTPSDRALVVERDQHDQLDEQDLMMRLVAPTNRVDKTLDCISRDEMLTTWDDPSLDALPDQSEIDNFIDSGDSFRKNQERCPLLTSRGLESLPFTGSTLRTSAGAKSC